MATTLTRRLLQPCRPLLLRPPSALPGSTRGAGPIMAPRFANPELRQPNHARYSSSSSSSSASPMTTSQRAPAPQSTGRFNYSIAASYIAKDHRFDPSTHIFHFNPYNRVHQPRQRKSKALRPHSGQDAFFVSRIGDGTAGAAVALGVADGVGGWMDSGVDPADFSHGFCDYAAAEASGYRGNGNGKAAAPPLTAKELMQRGYDAVCHDPAIPAGGSTAVVALLGEDGNLEVANLGDSGYIHLRLNGVHGHSSPQTHAFNTPYQLSAVPPSVMRRVAAFGGAQLSDQPSDADVTRLSVRHGDVVVFATDGLWDNLFDQDILRVVSRAMTGTGAWTAAGDAGIDVAPDIEPLTRLDGGAGAGAGGATLQGLLATGLVAAAKAASVNTRMDGPFAKEVKKYYPLENWRGGKVDDICVVAVVVSEIHDKPVKPRL